jgi:hypothetical protein
LFALGIERRGRWKFGASPVRLHCKGFYNQFLGSRLVRGTPNSANVFNFLPRKFPTIEEHFYKSGSKVYLRFQSIYHVEQLLTYMENLWFFIYLFIYNL